ncbi:hypothetical protein BIGDOG_35 [Serratia phage vB_SmaS_Bigdog]|uniref:Uncharacterized protein n=1 Tax=Serratia phage vB_SmaS_Bigdog TaxID=2777364 RepID=A0A7T3NA21_9CAUD|nr:hypothetical protein QJS28_gp35 [Serratia phage vB_SmaS_Bigdog]QPX75139.1 hypothetical protein BIGDOG_35 [Serratia phage vB_SmaS_Bigdog]
MISKRNGNELSSGISSDGKPYFVFAPNGGLMLRGLASSVQETIKAPKIETISGVKFISCEIGSGIGVSKFDSLFFSLQ